jgi:hypothetical protein
MQCVSSLCLVAALLAASVANCFAKAGSTWSRGSQEPHGADLITQEITELKAMVQICKDRIELLEELNRTVKSGLDLSLPETHVRLLKEQLPLMSDVTYVAEDRTATIRQMIS